MAVRPIAFALLLLAGMPHARANTVDCGGNSFSYAEVRKAPPGKAQRGPLVVGPDSLCADLIERRRRPPINVDIVIDPRSSATAPADPARPQNRKD